VIDDALYLDVDDVVRLHARIFAIDVAAARDRLRDAGILESALARPINHATYEGADMAMQAAILAHGIAQSQSFLDWQQAYGPHCHDHVLGPQWLECGRAGPSSRAAHLGLCGRSHA
jgi:hypothetical protein